MHKSNNKPILGIWGGGVRPLPPLDPRLVDIEITTARC